MKRREFLKLLFWIGGASLGVGCSSKPKTNLAQAPTPHPTPSPTPFLNTNYYQLCDIQKGVINSVVEIHSQEKPVVRIESPYVREVEVKQKDYKIWVAKVEHFKPTDYQITIQAGDQQENLTLEGLLSQQEYQTLASIQETIDQMYHQLLRDQRLGQGLEQKKNTLKKAAQYASHETPQNTQAIQATLALAHATANKNLPENPDEIYNLVKKTSQNPLLWDGANTYEYHDDYGNRFAIYTHNQAEHAWLLSRVLAELEQKHGPAVSRDHGLLIGHNTSWWSQIQQIATDIKEKLDKGQRLGIAEGDPRIGYLTRDDIYTRNKITHPDYLDLATRSADWYITHTRKGKAFFPVDDQTIKQKLSKPEDRALALQLLAETPFKTWNEKYTGMLCGFQAAKTFWNHHVPGARKVADLALQNWPMWNNKYNILQSFYIILGDAFHHGEQHSISKLLGFPLDKEEFHKEYENLIKHNRESPHMEDEYFKKYPDAPNVILSRKSQEWRGNKFLYSVTHYSPMYADETGWPKRRPNEREYYEEMIPAMAAAIVLPWTYENTGVFRAETAVPVSDETANTLKNKYGSDLAIGPANLVGPFLSKKAARKDWEKAKQVGGYGSILPERPRIAFVTPRHTNREIPESGHFFIWRG